ncbi:FGGY-family carbohydrate kinase [Ornithinicoccus halotolerans]|uniref:FGGY-family carbohydrate kinase n=1 Tax=Ornithinicoccus halotolerans TaxID=1748220 RepID=UPI001294A02D|nr:FGGY family carbohydrate kinase [Ornithinicoccus halotolerans]
MFLGIDIGTGSSKAVLANAKGAVVRQASRGHRTCTPRPGWYEHDADGVWWDDVVALCQEVLRPGEDVEAVGVSGIGPALVVTDADDRPLRPGILYGIDTRAAAQAEQENQRLGEAAIRRLGNPISTQSVGPKLAWLQQHEPEVWSRVRRWYSAPGWVVRQLTGEYTLDRYSASASDPLYDMTTRGLWDEEWGRYPQLERPRLAECAEVVGAVRSAAAEETGIPVGTPVVAGTIDAMAEAYSAGVTTAGDTMVMYGSTLFLIQVVDDLIPSRLLWATEGLAPDRSSLAAGMATGGLVTSWLAEVLGRDYDELVTAAQQVPAGSEGLLLLPYLSGERTPVYDPAARGSWTGLTLGHGPGHLYRSALEGVCLGVRHNLQAMADLGAPARRLVAVGGGTAQRLWLQILSDATGLPQDLPTLTVGASYGDARLAADAAGVDTRSWNPVAERIEPDPEARAVYDELFEVYTDAYRGAAPTMHRLAELARG